MASPAIGTTVHDSELRCGQVADVALPKLERVLLCSDFAAASESATVEAIDLCKRTGASLCVLHVDEYGDCSRGVGSESSYLAQRLQSLEQYMKSVVERARNERIAVDALTVSGHPPVTIVEMIASYRPDLAIMGTNGIRGFERMIFGSTAEAVFRHASCPVLIAGPKASSKRQRGCGPVVFATDFHEPAGDVARYALALAQVKGVPLHCLHVLPLIAENDRQHTILNSIMSEALRRLTKDLDSNSCRVSEEVVFDSEISHAVVSYVEKKSAECIVLGVNRGMLLSSHRPPHLTYRMIATAPCPVLTISREAISTARNIPIAVYDS
jgi:nucleotide-binding universal stress UspA family protein